VPLRASRCFALAIVVVATMVSTAAIVATYSRLSNTTDEPIHVVAGLEFLQDGRYAFWTENPPLARVALAIIPYLRGARLPPPSNRPPGFFYDIFYGTPDYIGNVTAARVANLFFFWMCIALTWRLAGGGADPWVAALASAAVATLPSIVAHSGFATTDIPFVASFLLVLVALRRALERPDLTSGAWFGAAVGLALATKFTTLVFLPPAVAAIVASHSWDRRREWLTLSAARSIGIFAVAAAPVAMLVVWACYGFHIGRLSELPQRFGPFGGMPTTGWPAAIRNWRIPGHEFLHGLLYLQAHTIWGHPSTLFDQFSQRGFLIYYPVVLATKTPLPFVALAGLGLFGLIRTRGQRGRSWFVGLALGALGVLLVSLTSPINLGSRHVLVIYPLVALAAAFGVVRVAERTGRILIAAAVAVACIGTQAVLLVAIMPNQITFFNVLAGSEPAYISSDSDFDWGQDLLAMEKYFRLHHVPELYVALSGTAKPCALVLPPLKGLPTHPVSGWIAVSERIYRQNRGRIAKDPCGGSVLFTSNGMSAPAGWLNWLKTRQPTAIIGKTIRLYNVQETP